MISWLQTTAFSRKVSDTEMNAFPSTSPRSSHGLAALKQRLTIPVLWARLGLPGSPRATGACRSPFREDRTPSFSIHDEGRRWKDFGTGEGGDAIDFIARACALGPEEAVRRFLAMAGAEAGRDGGASSLQPPRAMRPALCPVRLPPLRRGTGAELEALAHSRGLHPAAIALAQSLGLLAFAEVCGQAAWVLLDPSRRIAEARRMDRQVFPAIGELAARKAHTLRGSAKSWPLGAALLETLPHFRAVMLVEGGPDLLAALHFCLEREVDDVLPLAMLGRGTGARIDPAALALIKGRRVRLYPHHDADGGGVAAAQGWALQLCAHGCEVDFFAFANLTQADGSAVGDLNEAVFIPSCQVERRHHLLP